ncbi:hypothetical protein RchiOBHm_Chr2g0152241 [Rosa chinensis]|uniref:Uncharacterized protein n=1 Tax=Rosa chinensis TaxID=74649 RepID=A0A2P6S0E2_ROSCH|nr:hypothetical protein RchiOBHm_Chr2g0152241 [Rosa chinensis]
MHMPFSFSLKSPCGNLINHTFIFPVVCELTGTISRLTARRLLVYKSFGSFQTIPEF